LRYYYTEFLDVKPAPSPVAEGSDTVEVLAMMRWLTQVNPRSRLDAYPLLVVAKDLLSRFLENTLTCTNKELEAMRLNHEELIKNRDAEREEQRITTEKRDKYVAEVEAALAESRARNQELRAEVDNLEEEKAKMANDINVQRREIHALEEVQRRNISNANKIKELQTERTLAVSTREKLQRRIMVLEAELAASAGKTQPAGAAPEQAVDEAGTPRQGGLTAEQVVQRTQCDALVELMEPRKRAEMLQILLWQAKEVMEHKHDFDIEGSFGNLAPHVARRVLQLLLTAHRKDRSLAEALTQLVPEVNTDPLALVVTLVEDILQSGFTAKTILHALPIPVEAKWRMCEALVATEVADKKPLLSVFTRLAGMTKATLFKHLGCVESRQNAAFLVQHVEPSDPLSRTVAADASTASAATASELREQLVGDMETTLEVLWEARRHALSGLEETGYLDGLSVDDLKVHIDAIRTTQLAATDLVSTATKIKNSAQENLLVESSGAVDVDVDEREQSVWKRLQAGVEEAAEELELTKMMTQRAVQEAEEEIEALRLRVKQAEKQADEDCQAQHQVIHRAREEAEKEIAACRADVEKALQEALREQAAMVDQARQILIDRATAAAELAEEELKKAQESADQLLEQARDECRDLLIRAQREADSIEPSRPEAAPAEVDEVACQTDDIVLPSSRSRPTTASKRPGPAEDASGSEGEEPHHDLTRGASRESLQKELTREHRLKAAPVATLTPMQAEMTPKPVEHHESARVRAGKQRLQRRQQTLALIKQLHSFTVGPKAPPAMRIKSLLSLIATIYHEKIAADDVDDRCGNIRQNMTDFVREYFNRAYGLKALALKNLKAMVCGVQKFGLTSVRVRVFGVLCGLLGTAEWKEDACNLLLHGLGQLFPRKSIKEYMDGRTPPVVRLEVAEAATHAAFVSQWADGVIRPSTVQKLYSLAAQHPQQMVPVDEWMEMMLDEWRMGEYLHAQRVNALFGQLDKGLGVLPSPAFHQLVLKIDHELVEFEINEMFTEAVCESVDVDADAVDKDGLAVVLEAFSLRIP